MPLSDGHLFSHGLCCPSHPILLPFPSATLDQALCPSCHMSHPSDAGIRDSATHTEAQEGPGDLLQNQDSTWNWLHDQCPCRPLLGPLLHREEQVGLPVGPAQALSCVSQSGCPQEQKALRVPCKRCAGGFLRHPLN